MNLLNYITSYKKPTGSHVTRCLSLIGRLSAVCRGPLDLQNPFLCLDLVYISVLLQELGFPANKQLRVSPDLQDPLTRF